MNHSFTRLHLSIFLLGSLGWQACRSKNNLAQHISPKASFVVAINPQSVALKAVDFKQLLHLFDKSNTSSTDERLTRLRSAGIDLLATAYVFGEVLDSATVPVTTLVSLGDAAKFEAFLKLEKWQAEAADGGLQFMANDTLVAGWDKGTAYVTTRNQLTVATVKKRLLAAHARTSAESLPGKNTQFGELAKKDYDALVWGDVGSLRNLNNAAARLPGAMGSSSVGGTFNFEKGRLVFDGTAYRESKQPVADLMDQPVASEFIRTIPTAAPLLAVAVHVRTEALKKALEASGALTQADQSAQTLGLTSTQLIDMWSGDLAFSLVGPPDTTHPVPPFYLRLGIRNAATLQKLVTAFEGQGLLAKEGAYLTTPAMADLAVFAQDKQLVITSSPTLRDGVMGKQTATLNDAARKTLESGALGLYFDFEALATLRLDTTAQGKIMTQYLRAVTLNATQQSATVSDIKMALVLKDQSRSSLLTLIEMGQKLDAAKPKEVEVEVAQ